MSWESWVTADSLAGGVCISVALDWYNPDGGHSDAQETRNCRVGTTYHSVNMPQDLNTQNWTGSHVWHVNRLQIATVDPDTLAVSRKACPSGSGRPATGATPDNGHCSDWRNNGAAPWGTTAAKIYRKGRDGTMDQNLPKYPADYDIQAQMATAF
jgi:hypothetical protein